MHKVGLESGISCSLDWRPKKHDQSGFTFQNAIFDKVLLHSKVAKAELYAIDGYHNE